MYREIYIDKDYLLCSNGFKPQGSDVDGHKMGFLKRDPSTFEKQGNVAKTCAYLRHIVHYLVVPWLEKIASNELSGGNE